MVGFGEIRAAHRLAGNVLDDPGATFLLGEVREGERRGQSS